MSEENIAKVGGSFLVLGFACYQLGKIFQKPDVLTIGQRFMGLGVACLIICVIIYFFRNRSDD